jgi:hypothetical protein
MKTYTISQEQIDKLTELTFCEEHLSIRLLLEEWFTQQSISDGTKVIFDNKGFSYEEFGYENISKKTYKQINGRQATIKQLDTYSELGNKDGEYYTIEFSMNDGTKLILEAISGYHLTILN